MFTHTSTWLDGRIPIFTCYLMACSLVSFLLPGCQLNCLYPYKQLCLLEIIYQLSLGNRQGAPCTGFQSITGLRQASIHTHIHIYGNCWKALWGVCGLESCYINASRFTYRQFRVAKLSVRFWFAGRNQSNQRTVTTGEEYKLVVVQHTEGWKKEKDRECVLIFLSNQWFDHLLLCSALQ